MPNGPLGLSAQAAADLIGRRQGTTADVLANLQDALLGASLRGEPTLEKVPGRKDEQGVKELLDTLETLSQPTVLTPGQQIAQAFESGQRPTEILRGMAAPIERRGQQITQATTPELQRRRAILDQPQADLLATLELIQEGGPEAVTAGMDVLKQITGERKTLSKAIEQLTPEGPKGLSEALIKRAAPGLSPEESKALQDLDVEDGLGFLRLIETQRKTKKADEFKVADLNIKLGRFALAQQRFERQGNQQAVQQLRNIQAGLASRVRLQDILRTVRGASGVDPEDIATVEARVADFDNVLSLQIRALEQATGERLTTGSAGQPKAGGRRLIDLRQ